MLAICLVVQDSWHTGVAKVTAFCSSLLHGGTQTAHDAIWNQLLQALTYPAASSRDLPVIVSLLLAAVQQGVWLLTQGCDSDWARHLWVWLWAVLRPASLRHFSWHGGQLRAALCGAGPLHRLDWLLSFQSGQQGKRYDLIALPGWSVSIAHQL